MTLRRTSIVLALASLAVGGACTSDDGKAKRKADKPGEAPSTLAGVWPEKFQCSSVVTPESLSPVLGGTARQIDNPASVPRGVAHPCVYEVSSGVVTDAGAPVFAYWTFDFDCRDNYKQTADALFAQYKTRNADLVETYDRMSDAGAIKANDAGIEAVRPGESSEVAVGAKGLDHHGQGLLFIDDDAPCYVRVSGTDTTRRLELAKLIAKNLTALNAPMTPRAIK
ncbi:MAG: hypothetical protein M3680_34765 [Myxococcota bacterium]|nr:hypothetical protein [Myxococcota bacterium]